MKLEEEDVKEHLPLVTEGVALSEEVLYYSDLLSFSYKLPFPIFSPDKTFFDCPLFGVILYCKSGSICTSISVH